MRASCRLLVGLLAIFLQPSCRESPPEGNECAAPQPEARDADTSWYKNAVIYNLEVGSFQDSDGDGRGDFRGLQSRLGYLDSLGITALWLSPFFVSPRLDDGYDVSDYLKVDSTLGAFSDFIAFVEAAHSRGMRVITDLAVNHTSIQHPWFRAARQGPASPFRDWYVWSEKRPQNWNRGMVFPGIQDAIWTKDSVSGQYYYHRFYDFQPDLNMQNGQVRAAVRRIVRFWMEAGLDGFRLDGVPFFIEEPQRSGDDFPRHYQLLTELRRYTESIRPGAVILGEANVLPDETVHYFGAQGERMQMMFNFYVNQHLFLALATGDAAPLTRTLCETRDIPGASQWAYFLRNHDEIDLGRLNHDERQAVYEAFGPDSSMQLYDRGIRRRLAPMLGDATRLRMAYSLLFSLPGTPVLRYGDEIGMGDDLSLQERLAVRTPMQWTTGSQAGFSVADSTFRPIIDSGRYAYTRVNVAAQLADSSSLLHWIRWLIAVRTACPELRSGNWRLISTGSRQIIALQYQQADTVSIVLHNLKAGPATAALRNAPTVLHDIRTGEKTADSGALRRLRLRGFGSCWLRSHPLR